MTTVIVKYFDRDNRYRITTAKNLEDARRCCETLERTTIGCRVCGVTDGRNDYIYVNGKIQKR